MAKPENSKSTKSKVRTSRPVNSGSKGFDSSEFALFTTGNDGIEGWLRALPPIVEERLNEISPDSPLTHAQLNQLLTLSQEAALSPGFFRYYFGNVVEHPWNIQSVPHFSKEFFTEPLSLRSQDHLFWGMYRLYVDGLLYYGSVRSAYRDLRSLSFEDLREKYRSKRLPTNFMKGRGAPLQLQEVNSTDRYLIAEQACKAFESEAGTCEELSASLWNEYEKGNRKQAQMKITEFLSEIKNREVLFALDEIKDEDFPKTKAQLNRRIEPIFGRWKSAREAALKNSKLYLSMVNELDIYVATSMRSREDFLKLSDFCAKVFSDSKLKHLNIRYFDPTMSAANSHEDKGLIECLMVRCAKVLLYVAGEKDSYGKDAEAAMALSQGKPVVFYCEQSERKDFFNHVHPLSRLIEFETGVAVGAMAVTKQSDVVEILQRLFENNMNYSLEQKPGSPGFLLLKEELSESVVRLQSNDKLLTSSFWNYYHGGSKFLDQEVADELQTGLQP